MTLPATPPLRPAFRSLTGPLDMRAPKDPAPTLTDFRAAWDNGTLAYHEDFLDRLNADHSWGSDNPGETGGSGISLTYGASDADAVWVWMHALEATPVKPNDEHRIRLLRAYSAGAAMFRHAYPNRRIVALADEAMARWWEPGQYNCNVPYFLEQARLGKPMPGEMGRAFAWIMLGEAMALKAQPSRSRVFGEACLHLCEVAANPFTGQIVQDSDSSVEYTDVTYVQHWIFSMIAANALAHRLGWGVPGWTVEGAMALHAQEPCDYYGSPSQPKFVRTVDNVLLPATREGGPGPNFYGELCAVLYKRTQQWEWLERSCKFGIAAASVDEKAERLLHLDHQGRLETALLRGILT